MTPTELREKAKRAVRGAPVGGGDGDTFIVEPMTDADIDAVLRVALEAAAEKCAERAATYRRQSEDEDTAIGGALDLKHAAMGAEFCASAIRAMKPKEVQDE